MAGFPLFSHRLTQVILPCTNIPPMSDIDFTTEGVAKLLHGLNPNKATGPDDIPARILQLAANELAPVLQIIFQKSLDTGKLPLSWSQANIAPIFKKGDRSLAANYRPISLTSICCKILEHIIFTGTSLKLEKRRCQTTMRQHCFSNRVINNWNSLPESIISAPTVNSFKSKLDQHWYNHIVLHPFGK